MITVEPHSIPPPPPDYLKVATAVVVPREIGRNALRKFSIWPTDRCYGKLLPLAQGVYSVDTVFSYLGFSVVFGFGGKQNTAKAGARGA